MKPRRVLAFVAVLAGYALMLEIQFACGGPGGPATVFSVRRFPDPPFREFLAGALGVLQPSYPTRDLVVAYRYLSGNPLNQQEQAAIQSSLQQHIASGPDPARPAKAAAEQWRLAKIRAGFSGGVRVNVYKRSGDYSHYLNCLAHAFLTAIDTLQARAEYHGPESDDLRDWVRAQDQVFSNCSGGAKIPGSSRPTIDSLLYADRSYQIAAAHFYSGDFDEAYARFMEIGGDSESPWRVWGRYLAGRALIRKATVPFDSRGYDSQALDQAEAEFRAVVDDPALAPTHGPARQLLTLIAFKKPSNEWGADERAMMNEQLRRLSSSLQETEAGDDFVQLADTYRGMLTRLHRIEPAELDEMSRWILAFRGRLDFSAAFQRWQTTREVPWLVAALKGLRPSHGERLLLLRHAKEIPAASPAYPSVAYHAARVLMAAGNTAEARQWLTRVLENKSQRLPLSSTNQLLGLRMGTARSLDKLLADAPRKVLAMASIDLSARELLASQNWKSFKRLGSRTFFDSDSALAFNQLFPLNLLAASARNPKVPNHLRKRLAAAAWTRAVLLEETDTAADLSSYLEKLAPELRAGLRSFRSASSEDERRFEATMMILRNPGLKPSVSIGVGRLYGLDKNYQTFYNWWCGFGQWEVSPWRNAQPWGHSPWPRGYPDFIRSQDRETARAELDRLAGMGSAYEYAARQVMARTRSQPSDPRLPEALHRVVYMTRWSCLRSDKGGVSRAAFQMLHGRYPNSEWAKKTPYWFR